MTREQIIGKIMEMDGMLYLGRSLADTQLVPRGEIQSASQMYDYGYIRGIAWALYCTGFISFEEKEILNGDAIGEEE